MTAPHADQALEMAGRPLGEGSAAMILVHGRGADARSILELAVPLFHDEFTYLAPSASGNTWYPYSFMADIASNEPGISSGLAVLDALVNRVAEAGIPPERLILAGFSQGACLMSEYAVRHPARYGGVIAFSGGLIGPPGTEWPQRGDFAGTPVFFGCSDIDAHVPKSRVDESAEVMERMGAVVEKRLYRGMGHFINEDEIDHARSMLEAVVG